MSPHRKDEPSARHLRTDRVVMAHGRWYVATREKVDVGPYPTQEAAAAVAEQFGKALDGVEDAAITLAFIREFARRRVAVAH